MSNFLVMTFEVAFELDRDAGDAIRSALEDLRSQGAARVVKAENLTQDEYDRWYSRPFLSEVEVPVPQIVRFD